MIPDQIVEAEQDPAPIPKGAFPPVALGLPGPADRLDDIRSDTHRQGPEGLAGEGALDRERFPNIAGQGDPSSQSIEERPVDGGGFLDHSPAMVRVLMVISSRGRSPESV